MKKYYNVSFQYSDSVYCANIAHAENVEAVEAHYSKYAWYKVTEAPEYDVEAAKRRGMPIVEVETPAEEITAELEIVETDAKDDLSDLAKDFADNYEDCATRFDDLMSEAADSSIPVYTAELLDFVREEPDAVEDYINENGWPGSLDRAAAGAMYERNYCQLDGQLDDIKWYFAVKALCEYSVGNVTTEAAGDILADLADRLDYSIMSPVDCRMAAQETAEKYGWL